MKIFSKKDDDSFFSFEEENNNQEHITAPHVLTPEEVLKTEDKIKITPNSSSGALDALKKRLAQAANDYSSEEVVKESKKEEPKPEIKEEIKEEPKKSLLDKCLPYIIDENGEDASVSAEPLYKLESVAEILKNNSEKTLERLSQKYEIEFDDLGYSPEPIPEKKEEKIQEPIVENKVEFVQSNVPFVISDIDAPSYLEPKPQAEDMSNTATITFTPISSNSGEAQGISVSTNTRSIDLTGEFTGIPNLTSNEVEEEVHLEKNEFEDFVPKEEFKSLNDSHKFLRKLSIIKRRAFISMSISIIFSLVLLFMKLPFMTGVLLAHTVGGMIVCSSFSGLIVLSNIDMFKGLAKIFQKESTADVSASLASIFTLAYAVFGILSESLFLDMLLLLAIILTFRAIGNFLKASHNLTSFKGICQNNEKNAVKLISDPSITFSMSKNSIEGDVLIAAPQKANHIEDFMKYSSFGSFLNGKLPLITAISLLLSAISAFACTMYFEGAVYGVYAAAATQCFCALPTIFLIDSLPLYRASKKLKRVGAVIFGKAAAEQLEAANAVVLSSEDIFPAGTVTLHQMKVLSENDLQDTLIRAASLTNSLNSTLAPIFKQIAGSGNITSLPDSDTVKYEDRMGISGWVDNRLLFIGNRTLMEAHGIDVPSVEVDRKILRQGYFPIYVATREKACALLVVQYNVSSDVAKQLRRLTFSGVTLLINNCDPNLTEEMICDYLGLYDDSVKVMSAAGSHIFKSTCMKANSVSSPAAFKNNPLSLPTLLNCSARIKTSNIILAVCFVICSALGAVMFAYTSFGASNSLITDTTLLIYTLISTAVSYIAYFIKRP